MKNIETIIKALSNSARWKVLQWLKEPNKHFKGQKTDIEKHGVCNGLIQDKLTMPQSTTSHHLKILKESGLLTAKCSGQWTYYKRNETFIDEFKKSIKENL